MHHIHQQMIELLLEKITQIALEQPDALFLFVADCTALLAMKQLPDADMPYFENEVNKIIDAYMGTTILDSTITRDNNQIH